MSSDRCAVCGERVAGVVAALDHYLAKHPRSDLLHDTVSKVAVRSECTECAKTFVTTVSVGIDARPNEAMLTVSSYCDECVENDPLSGVMVREMASEKVLDNEVPSDA